MYTAIVQITDVTFAPNPASNPSGNPPAPVVTANLVSLVTAAASDNVFSLVPDDDDSSTIILTRPPSDAHTADIIQLTFQLLDDEHHALVGITGLTPAGDGDEQAPLPEATLYRDLHGSQLVLTSRYSPANWAIGLVIERHSDGQFGVFKPIAPRHQMQIPTLV